MAKQEKLFRDWDDWDWPRFIFWIIVVFVASVAIGSLSAIQSGNIQSGNPPF